MTDLRQAAQQALEALEGWENCDKWVWPETALEQSKRNTTESLAALRAALEQQQAEPVSMRMPKVGDKVICLEDESLGEVVSLTAGGSPDITFDDGTRGTYLLREFAELFGYAEQRQQQAEPVACRFCFSEKGCWTWQCYHCGEIDDVPQRAPPQQQAEPVAYFDFQKHKFSWAKNMKIGPVPVSVKVEPMKLYLEAPQRQWVGLTPEEILNMFDINNVYGSKWIEFARTVETKLKERNNV